MYSKSVILVAVMWLAFCGCSIDNNNEISASYEKRKQIIDKWIGAMDNDNIVIAKIAEILRRSIYMVEPAPSPRGYDLGIRVLEEADVNNIPVVAILPGDEDVGLDWESKIRSFWGALFIPDYPMVIIRNDEISNFWRGIIMVYQGVHVTSYILSSFDDIENPITRMAVGEFCAYNLIFDVLNRKGGDKYQEILKEKTLFIKSQFGEKGVYLPPDFLEEDRLNDVFGEAPFSSEEVHVRWKIFWIHSVFKAIEELNEDKKIQDGEKIEYLIMLL